MAERPHVVVVGLGPAGGDLIGVGTAELLRTSRRVWLRTTRHPSALLFEGARSCDDLYETAGTFDEVYLAIAERLVSEAEAALPEPVVYAVPGSPLVAERTVAALRADTRVEVSIVPALSFLDVAWAALGIDPLAAGVRLIDATEFAATAASERGPFLVAQCWSRHLLSEVKLAVAEVAPASLPRPVLLHHLGLDDEVVATVDWWELDRTIEPDHLTSLYVPRLPYEAGTAAGEQVARLVALMDTLREECPWDRAQDHASLMPHLVEESYEALDALSALAAAPDVDAGYAHLEEELGDLLFQIVFHARLADEGGHFDLAGVARTVHEKLVHRHPHVFADADADDALQVEVNWEEIKKSEKGRVSVTDGIPAALPALVFTAKLARKARAVGLEPSGPEQANNAASELAALVQLAERAMPHPDDPLARDARDVERRVGELLFAVVNLAQRVGIDAEQALRERALVLRADIRRGEGVPKELGGNR
ncbi:MAG TPA: MazG family protein [Acidimicrobiales bacterium]|nr:MazG family protein [Acidimicrobiales bacterium]